MARDVLFELRQLLRASSRSSRFCLATISPTSSLALASSSARRTANRAFSSATSIVRGLHGGLGLGLDDFLLGEPQIEVGLLERELLIRRIEFDDDVAGLHGGAGAAPAERWSTSRRPAGTNNCMARVARRSPVAWTVTCTRPRCTRVVGMSRSCAGATRTHARATRDHDHQRQRRASSARRLMVLRSLAGSRSGDAVAFLQPRRNGDLIAAAPQDRDGRACPPIRPGRHRPTVPPST